MKFTLSWLKDHLITNASLDEIVTALNAIGLEVNNLKNQNKYFDNILTGRIVQINRHPNADKLKICIVDVGKEKFQVICGANNVKENMISVFAPIDTYIPYLNTKIKKTFVCGIEHGFSG